MNKVDASTETVPQKMDPELKAKWVEALRSGEFKQSHVAYYSAPGYCCLGVLAAICSGKRGSDIHGLPGALDFYLVSKGVTDRQFGELVNMNDRDRKTFPEIADYIEKNL